MMLLDLHARTASEIQLSLCEDGVSRPARPAYSRSGWGHWPTAMPTRCRGFGQGAAGLDNGASSAAAMPGNELGRPGPKAASAAFRTVVQPPSCHHDGMPVYLHASMVAGLAWTHPP